MSMYIEWECFCKGRKVTQNFLEKIIEEIEEYVGTNIHQPIKIAAEEFAFSFSTESFSAQEKINEILEKWTNAVPVIIQIYESIEDGTYYRTNYRNGEHETVEGYIVYPEHSRIIY